MEKKIKYVEERIEYNACGYPINPFDEYKGDTSAKNMALLNCVRTWEKAIDENDKEYLVGSLNPNKVIFCAGLWRVQREFTDKIIYIRDKNLVMGAKKDYTEKTKFDFYDAYSISYNCYGFYKSEKPDYVIAKYPVAGDDMIAYGETISEARAYFAIRLYDRFQDPIDDKLRQEQRCKQKE